MKYLITGGAGFIGSSLAENLVHGDNEIYILDNLSTGSASNLSNIKESLSFFQGNILDHDLVNKLVSECDYVIHFAAALGVFNIINRPLESLQTNLKGTENVLESANKYRRPILLASTSEIYGKNNKVPLSEDDDRVIGHPLKSRWSYSEAKAIDESLAYFYYLNNELPIRIVRFFNTVGPRQVGNYGMVVPRFVTAALRNEPLQVYGSGEQIRCFCHVDDAVSAVLQIMESESAIGQVFNVGNDHQISIINLANRIIEITSSKSQIMMVPYSIAYPVGFEDIQRRVPDISKIKKSIGWAPQIGLDQIIKDIAKYYTK